MTREPLRRIVGAVPFLVLGTLRRVLLHKLWNSRSWPILLFHRRRCNGGMVRFRGNNIIWRVRGDEEDREFWAWARDMHQDSRRPDGTSRSFVLARCCVFLWTRRQFLKRLQRKGNPVDVVIYFDLSSSLEFVPHRSISTRSELIILLPLKYRRILGYEKWLGIN